VGVRRGVPSQVGSRVRGYNLKLISTLHSDSIPETPSGKSGVDVFTPVDPMATPLGIVHHRPTIVKQGLQTLAG